MARIDKPTGLDKVWASGGDKVQPDDAKIARGWEREVPPRQYFNFIDNKQDQAIAHINQHGIPVWDSTTEYQGGMSYSLASNGVIYRCVATNTAQDPIADVTGTYWQRAFPNNEDLSLKADRTRRINTATGSGLQGGGDLSADRSLSVQFGQVAGTVAQGDDARIVGAFQKSDIEQTSGVSETKVMSQKATNELFSSLFSNKVEVTGSRSFATVYTNTSGRPMLLSIVVEDGITGATSCDLIIDGKPSSSFAIQSSANIRAKVTFIDVVPSGKTYSISRNDTNDVILRWIEAV